MPQVTEVSSLPDSKREILRFIKRNGEATIAEIADHQGISQEGARRQLLLLQQEGLVAKHRKSNNGRAGRPVSYYSLSGKGDHLFPRQYDTLSLLLMEGIIEETNEETLHAVLSRLAEKRVERRGASLNGKSLRERIPVLRDLYAEDDPYVEIQEDGEDFLLTQRNCPYYNVAMKHPELCSVSIFTLMRLAGHKVEREESFQNGDRCCRFRIRGQEPVPADFSFSRNSG